MTETSIHPPWWFWSIGVVLLLWGLMGIWFYWIEVTMSDATYVEIYGKELLDVRHRVPAWSISGYAIGVWGGLLGTICLLLRRRWALPFYIASLIGAILGWVWMDHVQSCYYIMPLFDMVYSVDEVKRYYCIRNYLNICITFL